MNSAKSEHVVARCTRNIGTPLYITHDFVSLQLVASTTKNIGKGPVYRVFDRWLGEGLLTSTACIRYHKAAGHGGSQGMGGKHTGGLVQAADRQENSYRDQTGHGLPGS
ncbi:hypothetical protein NQ317_000087 [Molorchus minor]|uniref:Uncharacterized protein n=1 Tax=Molorchus minor TaxID=1323400 RepID=A0ABQ9IXA0_9CUCU|nr:hypothetical protein NQ317_000087 [Molorchus minor]